MIAYPQLQQRRIGKVQIIDVKGDLTGPWALKLKSELSAILKNEVQNAVIINLSLLRQIDSLGVKVLIESIGNRSECALLNGNLSVMDMVNTVSLPHGVSVLRNEDDLVQRFGKYLVSDKPSESDKRKFARMHTALVLKFKCTDKKEKPLEFHAIVTNLSEGGLFAEYINIQDIERSQSAVNPFELQMLDLEVKLPNKQSIFACGKVVRRKLDGEQVGIGMEFYKIDKANKEKLQAFLALHETAE